MSHNDDFIGQLEDYLEAFDGVTPLPDRVRDAIRAELPSARQVQPRPGLMRVFTMLSNASAGARLGLAAAAVVVAVVLGAAFLNNNQRGGVVGGAPSPTPTATPAPTPTSDPDRDPGAERRGRVADAQGRRPCAVRRGRHGRNYVRRPGDGTS